MAPCCNSWSQNRSKEGLANKPPPLWWRRNKNDEAKSMREKYIEIVHPLEREHSIQSIYVGSFVDNGLTRQKQGFFKFLGA